MEGSASQAGFYYQNNTAALKILEALFFNTDISHVHVDNYHKGPHIDDVIVYRTGLTEYYQIKWSEDSDNSYTLFNLLHAEPKKKSIFRQLAEGYMKVSKNGTDFTITLFTTKRESAQKRPSESVAHSLPEIRAQVFNRARTASIRYDALSNYADYRDTVEKIRQECSLEPDAFDEFIKKLDFKFSQESVDQIQQAAKLRLERLGIEESALPSLLDGVVKWSITGEAVTKGLVLKQLGISDRFEDKLSHFFRTVDERFYIPNADLAVKLEQALNELPGGYIFIEGKPGIGKSTALTKFKEVNPHITLTYYCFIPDAQANFGEFRHKARYFLKSLCIAIEKQFPDVDLPMRFSDRFEEKLSAYINKLGTLGQKIIFIVDGLDHVHRDTTLHGESLLAQIKGVLPPGIYFVLSSQYKAVLSSSVAAQVDVDPRRHIIVNAFTQPEIDQYLRSKGLKAGKCLDEIERKSQGIPLYLHYISELLLDVEPKDYGDVLDTVPALVNGEINSYHEVLYQSISDDEFARWTLAVLAYRKEASTAQAIQTILRLAGVDCTLVDITGVVNRFSHLLRQKHGRAYTIFHNSFREFILQKTQDLKDAFNAALVTFYEQTPSSDEAYRNYFKHLAEIGQFKKVISAITVNWMKQAWRDLRSLNEIKENLSLALNACIQTTSLSEFIRIGFLKAQFDRLAWNLEQSNLDFPLLLLKAGETANSLRMIWDGDFVLVSKPYFSFYLGQYFLRTGHHLDAEVNRQGLIKLLTEKKEDDLVTVLQAMALVKEDIKKLFADIDEIKWVHTNKHKTDYRTQNFSNEENAQANFKIKRKVIEYLRTHRQFEKLNVLLKEFGTDEELKVIVQSALVQVLFNGDKPSALRILADIDFAKLDDQQYVGQLVDCSDSLTEQEVRQYFPQRQLTLPTLHEKVVEEYRMSYNIHRDILALFATLKPLLIFHPNEVNRLRLQASILPAPAKNLYESIFFLAGLWHKTSQDTLPEAAILHQAQQALQCLYQPRRKEFRTREYGLFDMNNDHYFIAQSIKHLFSQSFSLYARLLSHKGLETLVDYWLQLEQTQEGFTHYTVALTVAEQIHLSQRGHPSQLVYKIIQQAEAIVADEGDTDSRMSYSADVAEAYGACGFSEDFRRLYNQLVEMAFGVAHRKDYQASYIITPLEMYHETDPAGTPKRLAEVLHIQKRLAHAGNARIRHICLSNLIAFAAKHYPSLALQLLEKEEESLGREEAVNIVFTPMIKRALKEHLLAILAIIKTLPRWTRKPLDESYFTDLALELLNRALELHNNEIISDIIKVVKLNLIVELNDPKPLKKFAHALSAAGINPAAYGLLSSQNTEDNVAIEKKEKLLRENDRKFLLSVETPAFEVLLAIFEEGHAKFNDFVESIYSVRYQNRILTTFRNEYQRSKGTFEAFYQSLPASVQQSTNVRPVIKSYIDFKNGAANLHPGTQLTFSQLRDLFDKFVEEAGKVFPKGTLKKFVETEFEKEAWLENLLGFANGHRDHLFSFVISEENAIRLVKEASILQADDLLRFLRNWTSGGLQSKAILILANRLLLLNPPKAKVLLSEVANHKQHDLIFSRYKDDWTLPFDPVEAVIRIDKDFGKQFVLQSYLSQQGEYADSFIANFDKLLKYAKHFEDKGIGKVFYEANHLYNLELAQGLPEVTNDYAFVAGHQPTDIFTDAAIKHLVWLFNYPMVQVRQLMLQAVFDLLIKQPLYLKPFVQHSIKNGDDNQVEHALTVLIAISWHQPQLLFPFKADLLELMDKAHFNILESVKELLLQLSSNFTDFLTWSERSMVSQLNSHSPIFFNLQLVNRQSGKNFLFSPYQTKLLHRLFKAEEDEVSFPDDLYTDLVTKGWKDWDGKKEGAVHRRYNANTNFETIEIQSPYYNIVKSSINRIFYSKIRRGMFTPKAIDRLRRDFRIYDPSKLLYFVQPKPDFINWLSPNVAENAFNTFNDINDLAEQLAIRELDYITLAEYGNQRNEEHYDELRATTYFQAFAFLKREDFNLSSFENDRQSPVPLLGEHNLYAFEMPGGAATSTSFPVEGIKPLLEVSENKFRGEDDLVNANLLSDVFDEFGLTKKSLLELLTSGSHQPLQALCWQEPYTSGTNSRRYKTISAGFTLKIKREVLVEYMQRHRFTLCYDVKVKRSTDKYRPEDDMNWYEFEGMFQVSTTTHKGF